MLYLPRTLSQKLILLHINYNTILCIALKFILGSFFNIPLTLSLVRNTLALLFSPFPCTCFGIFFGSCHCTAQLLCRNMELTF
ncbi:hypothetical protein V1522DRAFT_279695 [Lipomyces starkeyi]